MKSMSTVANAGMLAGNTAISKSKFKAGLARINQELWLVLSLFVIAGLFNWLVASHRMILGLYTLPTIFSAYVYGRRHAVLTASASIFMVLILLWKNTGLFAGTGSVCAELHRVVRDRYLGVPAADHGLRDGNSI